MKKIVKITLILILAMVMQMQFNYVYARPQNWAPPGEIDDSGTGMNSGTQVETEDWSGGYDVDKFNPSKDTTTDSTYSLKRIGKIVTSIIRNVGIVISVIALMIIGLRTMVGSMEERSVYKQSLPGYILGVFMVVAISFLPSIIYEIMNSFNS